MSRISQNAGEQSRSPIVEAVEERIVSISLSTEPVLIVGVNRKLNTGSYENLDLYAGISVPLSGASLEDREALAQIAADAAELGFSIVSKETGDRYESLKAMQRGGRK